MTERPQDPGTTPDIDENELRRRVLHALGQPLVRLARAFGTPLADTLTGLRMTYFQQLKDSGVTLREIGELLGVSERQAKRLQQQLREQFFDVDQAHALPLRIEFMLWATSMSRARVKQLLSGHAAADVDAAIDALLRDGRIIEESGRTPRLSPSRAVNNLVRDTWIARVGGLNSLFGNLADVVYGRFFKNEPRAFARTMTFLVSDADFAELQRIFAEELVPRIAAMDAKARDAGTGTSVRLSLLWAPFDTVPAGPPSVEKAQATSNS